MDAFEIFSQIYLRARDSKQSGLANQVVNQADPNKLSRIQKDTITTMQEILCLNPINYFIVERTNCLVLMIEGLDTVRETAQKAALEVLHIVMTDLNYVPFKELAVLCIHLQGNIFI